MEVPHIVEPHEFDALQQHLESRRPSITPARVSNGSMLLTQIARCPHCGGGMSLRTGKGGQYRYYACSAAATKGKTACPGRSIPMEQLDQIVIDALSEKLLKPERIKATLGALATRLATRNGKQAEREKELNRDLRQVEKAMERLLEAVENGLVEDQDAFRKRMSGHRQRKDELVRLIAHGRRRKEMPSNLLSPSNLVRFTNAIRSRLDDPRSNLRRGYVRLLVDRVIVGEDQIEVRGTETALLSAVSTPDEIEAGVVPSSIPDWRRGWDSNPRYLLEAQRFSRPPRSTTPAPLRKAVL